MKTRVRRGRKVAVRYFSTSSGAVALEVFRKGRRVARKRGTARNGTNAIAWNGRTGRRQARPGVYTLRITLTSADLRIARDELRIRILRPKKKR